VVNILDCLLTDQRMLRVIELFASI